MRSGCAFTGLQFLLGPKEGAAPPSPFPQLGLMSEPYYVYSQNMNNCLFIYFYIFSCFFCAFSIVTSCGIAMFVLSIKQSLPGALTQTFPTWTWYSWGLTFNLGIYASSSIATARGWKEQTPHLAAMQHWETSWPAEVLQAKCCTKHKIILSLLLFSSPTPPHGFAPRST